MLTQGKSILNEAIRISQKMETSISAISGIYSGIDGEYKVGALGSDIASLSGTLKKDVYQDTIDRMDKILNKLISDMPSYDNSLAQSMSSIQEVLDSVKGRISELRGLLDTGDVNLSYTEFSQRLKGLKANWDETTEDNATFERIGGLGISIGHYTQEGKQEFLMDYYIGTREHYDTYDVEGVWLRLYENGEVVNEIDYEYYYDRELDEYNTPLENEAKETKCDELVDAVLAALGEEKAIKVQSEEYRDKIETVSLEELLRP